METAGIHAGLKQRPPAVFSPFGVFAPQKLLDWKQPATMPAHPCQLWVRGFRYTKTPVMENQKWYLTREK
jgi:hypothetical protein